MRDLIFELNRDPVEDGLAAALAEHVSRLGAHDGLIVNLELPDDRVPLSARAETQLFGIGREALANVVKHANATTAWLRVQALPGRVIIEVTDDGRGFDVSAGHPGHFGLESMRSRATEIDGSLTITSKPGRGTVVRAEAPTDAEGISLGG
jgi:signal transduction histidine kinase